MSEPGTIAGTISQGNDQGLPSNIHYPALTVSATGIDSVPFDSTSGGVGFTNDTVVDSTEGTGATGEHDEVRGDEFEQQATKVGTVLFSMGNLPESPYYKYHTRELSSGNEKTEQKFYNSRSLGRGMNSDNIRNGFYYGEQEATLFTMGLPSKHPNITKDQVEDNEVEDVRDV